MDLRADQMGSLNEHPQFHFFEGDISINREWVEYHVKKCDIVLPLVAIATPATYVTDPLAVFKLDFEANLPIVEACVKHGSRLLFPSTSEVYGMCQDAEFHPYESNLVLGPIAKSRWIYACAKQLLDRVITAYGQSHGLQYTIFRPFNFIGTGLDSLHAEKEGSSRVVTQFLGHLVRGEDIQLVDGGAQRRSFTDIGDGIEALLRIIDNPGGVADGKIYNIGNPANDLSIRELAELMLRLAREVPEYQSSAGRTQVRETDSASYYGQGYQDMQTRVPHIANTCEELDWSPRVSLETSLKGILAYYKDHAAAASKLL
jgi:nucleoside-diphosphate-sugar epimerase